MSGKTTAAVPALWGVLLTAVAVNLDNAIDGRPAGIDILCSAAYIGYWSWFLLRKGGGKPPLGAVIWSVLSLLTAILGLPAAAFRLNWDFLLPFALLFLTPFHGLAGIAQGQWWLFYLAAIAVSLSWTMAGWFRYQEKTKEGL